MESPTTSKTVKGLPHMNEMQELLEQQKGWAPGFASLHRAISDEKRRLLMVGLQFDVTEQICGVFGVTTRGHITT